METKKWEDYDTIVCPDGTILDMQKLLEEQHRARTALIHLEPTFSAFVGRLKPVYTFRVKTQATDGKHIFINPQFTAGLSLTEKAFVMAHEIMHCLLNHLRRGKGHNPEKSNIAADYECNITLSDIGLFKFETIENLGAYIDKKYSGMGYETIYDKCSDSSKDNQDNSKSASDAKNNQLDPDYVKGWNQAMEDYKNGKLSL